MAPKKKYSIIDNENKAEEKQHKTQKSPKEDVTSTTQKASPSSSAKSTLPKLSERKDLEAPSSNSYVAPKVPTLSAEELEEYKSEEYLLNLEDVIEDEKNPATTSEMSEEAKQVIGIKKHVNSRIRLPPIKRSTDENISWDVKGITEPHSILNKQTNVIQRVNLRRKERHNNTLKEITLRMNDVNEAVEQEIREQAEVVVSSIQLIRENVENIMSNISEKSSFSKKTISRIIEILTQLNDSRITKIQAFNNIVKNLEKNRSDKFKAILKNAYQSMQQNMFLMPYEIQMFFEKKIQHLNQITMNNYHCYTELDGKLKVQMGDELKAWFLKIKLFEIMVPKKEEPPASFDYPYDSDDVLQSDVKAELMAKLENARKDLSSFKEVTTELETFNLDNMISVYEDFIAALKDAISCLVQTGLVTNTGINLNHRSLIDLAHLNNITVKDLRVKWREAIQDMIDTLDNNFRSISISTKIFNDYYDRCGELHATYEDDYFIYTRIFDKIFMRRNYSLNLLIDLLRQAGSIDSLNKIFKQVEGVISDTNMQIEQYLKDGIALIDKYCNIVQLNMDILTNELNRFVQQLEPPPDSDPRRMKKRASWMTLEELQNDNHLFSNAFQNCRYVVTSTNNWQFGIWQSLITLTEIVKQFGLESLTKDFVKDKQNIYKYYELNLKYNNRRLNGLKENILTIRRAELEIHRNRFLQHEQAIHEIVDNFHHMKQKIRKTILELVDSKYAKEANQIIANYDKVNKQRHINGMIIRIKSLYFMGSQEIQSYTEMFSNSYGKMLTDLRNSHLIFFKSIRFFSENGNFAADEVKHVTKQMMGVEKFLAKEFNKNQENLTEFATVCLNELTSRLEKPLLILSKILKEHVFKNNVERCIKKGQQAIVDDVFNIQYDIKKLKAKIKCFQDAAYRDGNLGNFEFLESTFTKAFKEILNEIGELKAKLAYKENLTPDENLFKPKKLESVMSQAALSATSMDSKTKQKETNKNASQKQLTSSRPIKNHGSQLYRSKPECDGTLVTNLHSKLWTAYKYINEIAMQFYARHGELIGEKLIPSDQRQFNEEVLPKFKYFVLQIECVWLECCKDFFELLKYFQEFIENYSKDTISKCFEERKKELSERVKSIMDTLDENIRSIEDYYMFIHGKLKVSFGHPEKSGFLDVVQSYMDNAENIRSHEFIKSLQPKKKKITSFSINTEAILLEMDNILLAIKKDCASSIARQEFENIMLQKMDNLLKILATTDILTSCVLPESSCEHIGVKKRLEEYKNAMQDPFYLKNDTTIKESESALSSAQPFNFEEQFLQHYNENIFILEKIDSYKEKCNAIHKDYTAIWTQEIRRIKKLYKLTYDNLPVE